MSLKKKAAAEYLGITERALEYHVKQGNIESNVETGKHGNYRVFHKRDLDKLKKLIDARRAPVAVAVKNESPVRDEQTSADLMKLSDLSPVQFVELLAAAMRANGPALLPPAPEAAPAPTVPLKDKLLLSLPEASDLSGIPVTKLRSAVKSGSLATVSGYGRGLGKVKRTDLESFIEKL